MAILELIHLFIESLDKYFSSVCELDIMFKCASPPPSYCYSLADFSLWILLLYVFLGPNLRNSETLFTNSVGPSFCQHRGDI